MAGPTSETTFGRYQLRELIGRGGMGQVFRAYDTETDRIVAIKVLPPHLLEDSEFQERFRREARMAASLNDPHVVPIHGFGEIDGRLYVDMRLIEGRDLVRYIADHGGRLRPDLAVAVIEQVAAALDSAHRAGLVHRDVKPSNVLIAKPRDFVYLIDFGLARATTDTSLTSTGYTMGTLGYIAPERFRGTTDSRADVYALACVLYECLTGSRPFPGDGAEEQIAAHFNFPPPKPSVVVPGIAPSFDAVIARGMAKDPMARYQTVMELAHDARAALSAAVPQLIAGAPAPISPPDRPHNRSLLLASLAGGGVIVVLVVVLVAVLTSSKDPPTNKRASRAPTSGTFAQTTVAAPGIIPPLPPFKPWDDFGRCTYPLQGQPSKPVKPPRNGKVSTTPADAVATLTTNKGDIVIRLSRGTSPCTVNSFVSLAGQRFFNDTRCSDLNTSPTEGTLVCGDPIGDGTGGPGYIFADEYPSSEYDTTDVRLKLPVVYPRGTLAMTFDNGSQFMLVYANSELPPQYTVFGTIDPAGLTVIDRIAQVGANPDGRPKEEVTIDSVSLD